jgi:hypothetical protein
MTRRIGLTLRLVMTRDEEQVPRPARDDISLVGIFYFVVPSAARDLLFQMHQPTARRADP